MHGIVSELPQPFFHTVEQIWQELSTEFGLKALYVTPLPHFSWQIAEQYDYLGMEKSISRLIQNLQPIQIRTTGLGIFTGIRPVLFIPVVKDERLLTSHAKIWEATIFAASKPSLFYHPDQWVPHITLAVDEMPAGIFASIAQLLSKRSFDWEMTINKIAIYSETADGNVFKKYEYTLEG